MKMISGLDHFYIIRYSGGLIFFKFLKGGTLFFAYFSHHLENIHFIIALSIFAKQFYGFFKVILYLFIVLFHLSNFSQSDIGAPVYKCILLCLLFKGCKERLHALVVPFCNLFSFKPSGTSCNQVYKVSHLSLFKARGSCILP